MARSENIYCTAVLFYSNFLVWVISIQMTLECGKTEKILDIIDSLGLIHIIDQPTRITEYSATLIDLILVADQNVVSDCAIIVFSLFSII